MLDPRIRFLLRSSANRLATQTHEETQRTPMQLASTYSRALLGIHAPLVHIEVFIGMAKEYFAMVGLPEAAVKESRERVRAAIMNSGFYFPEGNITVNLAPADLPKEGGRFDLGIALGILAASEQIPAASLQGYECVGELGLNGELRAVRGALTASLGARNAGRSLLVAAGDADEAALVEQSRIYPADHLLSVCAHLRGERVIAPYQRYHAQMTPPNVPDLADVRGQPLARRALEIAASGRHHLLMIGPPGTGKTMLASRLPGILPPMNEIEAIETAAVHSISHEGIKNNQWFVRPFRAPHHTASGVALVGGGSVPRPGEISLAHNGVLFLDELAEFDRRVLDVLREPLETGQITISRAARQADFPARFQLVAAMNPCPQGYDCDLQQHCRCTPQQRQRQQQKLSAPFIDRIDLSIEVVRVGREIFDYDAAPGEDTATVRARVLAAHARQMARQGNVNSALGQAEIKQFCRLTPQDQQLLEQAMERFRLSARAYHRILKVARTLADMSGSDDIETPHLTEALSYRALDRWRGD